MATRKKYKRRSRKLKVKVKVKVKKTRGGGETPLPSANSVPLAASEKVRPRIVYSEFNDFEPKNIKKIEKLDANKSANGVVFKVTMEGDKKLYILKMSQPEDMNFVQLTDNLMYECEVGLFLNEHRYRFPCFLKTFSLFKANDDKTIDERIDSINSIKDDLIGSERFTHDDTGLKNANIVYNPKTCADKNKYMVLSEYFDGETLRSMLSEKTFDNAEYNNVLFQIYGPLYALKDFYMHRDLHSGNVMIKQLDQPIQFTYHYGILGQKHTVTFTSKYLVKLIDYGRGYIREVDERFSTYDELMEKYVENPNDKLQMQLIKMQSEFNNCGLFHLTTQASDLRLINKEDFKLEAIIDGLRDKIEKQKVEDINSSLPAPPNKKQKVEDNNILPPAPPTGLYSVNVYLNEEKDMEFSDNFPAEIKELFGDPTIENENHLNPVATELFTNQK